MAKRADEDCFIRKDADGHITASVVFSSGDDQLDTQYVAISKPGYDAVITMSIECFRALNKAVEAQF